MVFLGRAAKAERIFDCINPAGRRRAERSSPSKGVPSRYHLWRRRSRVSKTQWNLTLGETLVRQPGDTKEQPMQARHFPGPWSVVDIPGGYRVQDATGHPLGYFYSWDDPAAARQADVLTRLEGRSMADGFARLSDRAPAPTDPRRAFRGDH